jgi:hypothetical protein
VVAQLVASQVVLSSIELVSKLVSKSVRKENHFYVNVHFQFLKQPQFHLTP